MRFKLWSAFENWLLPPQCVVSDQVGEGVDLSQPLQAQLTEPSGVCPCCCEPNFEGKLCGACLTQPPAFSRIQVGYYFAEPLSQLMHELKYQNQLSHARLFAELCLHRFDVRGVDALIPVPIHPSRRRQRGYNQALLIAEELGKRLQLPVLDQVVERVKPTPSQTHLTAKQRQQNLRGAFAVNAEPLTDLKSVALVDDVITTGATMQKLAEQIKKQSPSTSVQAWSIAKTK